MHKRSVVSRPTPGKDKFCPMCQHRLAFLRFIRASRNRHESENP
ncbi:hypothetical protein [Oxalobacter vibrioformis]|nr:hypothetical protein [Oxalobacter vibrioformis]